ncbi:beta-ketoacyl-[acyl-carrier-protein] synthase family protein (plasmid) [Streptomyces sp. BI20]|uniref:beta-ketoacyl-[acyl-carrier-protein] synthase family protein n=1 Tax=Streptomyces sp. BI20 TaxID=3403460 RepID=UPI003C72CC2A
MRTDGDRRGGGHGPRRVAVTGMGMITPAGGSVPTTWRAVLGGASTCAVDTVLDGAAVGLSCRVSTPLDRPIMNRKGVRTLDPVTRFALNAADEALADAALDPSAWPAERVAIVVGTGAGGAQTLSRGHRDLHESGSAGVSPYHHPASLANMTGAYLSQYLGARGPCLTVVTACASGTDAIATARDLLLADRCDIAVACGSEAGITPMNVAGFDQIKALSRTRDPHLASRPFDTDRDGFVIAEGAAALVLERPADAAARHARVHAYVSGHGATTDAHHPTAPHPEGLGAERALRAALRDAGLTASDIGHVNAHGTSTPANDHIEAAVLARVLPHHPPVTSSKGALGHTLGAAGAIEAALTIVALTEHTVPATAGTTRVDPACDVDVVIGTPRPVRAAHAVSNSFGFGGHNSVLVLSRP